jgi:PPM family protein phosphatase
MPAISSVFFLNEQGKRANLEDAIFPRPKEAQLNDRIFVVCDGVGGSNKGEVASQLVSQIIGHQLNSFGDSEVIDKSHIDTALKESIRSMAEYVSLQSEATGMATTLTIAVIKDKSILLAWCGDSRIMQIRNGQIVYQTSDHSLVAELVKKGEITEEEAEGHPQKNKIFRSVNADGNNSIPEFYTIDTFEDNDWLLLCTDGVLEQLHKKNIAEIFSDKYSDSILPDQQFHNLCYGKTSDNYSMYLLRLKSGKITVPGDQNKSLLPLIKKNSLAIVIALFLLLSIGFFSISRKKQHVHNSPNMDTTKQQSQITNKDTIIKTKYKPEPQGLMPESIKIHEKKTTIPK